jgi:hypothetical protein
MPFQLITKSQLNTKVKPATLGSAKWKPETLCQWKLLGLNAGRMTSRVIGTIEMMPRTVAKPVPRRTPR